MFDLIAYQIAFLVVVLAFDLNPFEWLVLGISYWRRDFFTRSKVFGSIENRMSTFAEQRWRAVFAVGVTAMVLRLLVLPVFEVPNPAIADEFSHLLLGDTLAHGRLINPAHPMWMHFESIHILMQPHYTSMYLPGQAIFLVVGFMLGNPWIGVLLSMGLMCGVITWMLQQILPARWALLGGTLCMVHIGVTSYWVNSYWGGCGPAIGGALAVGAVVNLKKRLSIGFSLLLALGVALLANSRPFEGLVFCIPLAGMLAWNSFGKNRFPIGSLIGRLIIPATLVLVLTGAGMAYFCYKVTGSPLKLPYSVNREMYGWPMTLPWYHPLPIVHRHREMRLYYEWELRTLEGKNSLWQHAIHLSMNFQVLWRFFLGPALTVPFLFIGRACKDHSMFLVSILTGVTLIAVLAEGGYPHYLAPVTGCIFALLVQCMRHMRAYRRKVSQLGLQVSRIVVMTAMAALVARVITRAADIPVKTGNNYLSWCCTPDEGDARAALVRRLLHVPGNHLVFVAYEREEFYPRERVYNEADIDGSRIVWARDMGAQTNLELLRYYPNRRAWVAYPDRKPFRLEPYPPVATKEIEK